MEEFSDVRFKQRAVIKCPHPVHIEMEEFSDVRFKQRAVIKFLTAEKVPPIEIHRWMQAIYGD